VIQDTGAEGLMIGRGAVRNPWIFCQVRDHLQGRAPKFPTGREVLNYIHDLYETVCDPGIEEFKGVQKIKKYANFIGEGVGEEFLHAVRRVEKRRDFFALCERYLDHDEPMMLETYQSGRKSRSANEEMQRDPS
jgi:tRNA-dihydrouridine synthase